MYITGQKNLSDAFGVSSRTIREWLAEGMPDGKKNLDNKIVYHLTSCIEWRISKAKGSTKKNSPNLAAEKALHERAKRKLAELELETKQGELLAISDSVYLVGKILSAVGGTLDSLPPIIKRASPDLTPRQVEIITAEIAKARNQMAHKSPYEILGVSDE